MIILDIETSGLYPEKHGLWQIGAIDSENINNYFIEECRIDSEDVVSQDPILVTGKTEKYYRKFDKQSQKKLLEKFFKWCGSVKIKNCICQNPRFDLGFISFKARRCGLKTPFHHRAFDLHSIAQLKYFQINNIFLFKEDYSHMGLRNILKFCGMDDERRCIVDGKISSEGKEHNAFEDCKLAGECFSRLIYEKNLFQDYVKLKISDYLKK